MNNQKSETNYCLGLDIGTNSVGWAITDPSANLLKVRGKGAIGVRLFDQGQTAESRRGFRSARRRSERRKERVRLLQELFSPLVLPMDDGFFIRLKESFLHRGDFGRENRANIFIGADFSEKEYYKKYPTIYHLRSALMNENRKFDIRLVYLAVHHIVKYRGNFLHDGEINFDGSELANSLADFFSNYFTLTESSIFSNIDIEKMKDIITNTKLFKSKKKEDILQLFKEEQGKDKSVIAFANSILGYTFSLNNLFGVEDILDDEEKEIKLKLEDSDFDTKQEFYLDKAGDYSSLLLLLKKIYGQALFYEILGGESTLSDAMIKKYNKHKEDLRILKQDIIYKYFPENYKEIFRATTGNNYVNYIKDKSGKERNGCGYEEFSKFLISLLKKKSDIEEVSEVIKALEDKTFLLRLNSPENGAIPFQMNLHELKRIFEGQSSYYPALKTIFEKVQSILCFKRPYYIGPLNPSSPYSWASEKVSERIYPWNFEDLVDSDSMAERFITRMTNYCSVFPEEEVLPRQSILYSMYSVLNELNKIKLNEKPISVDLKKFIFDNLFKTKKSISKKGLLDFLKKSNFGIFNSIEGLSEEDKFSNSLSSYIDLKNILQEEFDENLIPQYEKVIRIITLFDDIQMRKRNIEKFLPNIEEKKLNQLSKLRYTGWGRFSNKVINGVLSSEAKTILATLYESNMNYNEIIFSDSLGFLEIFNKEKRIIDKISYENCIEPLYCSPSVKRGVWQSIKVIEELEKFMGCAPSKIFVEVAKGEEEKKRSKTRERFLTELYSSIDSDVAIYNKEIHALLKDKINAKDSFESERVLLYFLQYGKCMYSGEPLDLSKLSLYQIDHIVPQSLIKDNSFENKVLVKTMENQYKSDNLAVSSAVRNKMKPFWDFLFKEKLIGKKKYNALLKETYDENDFAGFINRQLVETRQTTKEVINLLQTIYPGSYIYGIRAGLVSEFRSSYGFFKSRLLNDYHHAHDAYLNAVVGCFIKSIFTEWGSDYKINSYYLKNASIEYFRAQKNRVEQRDKFTYLAGKLGSTIIDDIGEIIWDESIIENIRRNINNPFCYVSKKLDIDANTDFYDQTLYQKDSNKKLIPRKSYNGVELPTDKYGGYTSTKPAYICAISYLKGKKEKQELINIPVKITYEQKTNPSALQDYLVSEYGQSIIILKDRIKKHQLVKYRGQLLHLSSASEAYNGVQLVVSPRFMEFLEALDKNNLFLETNEKDFTKISEEFFDHFLEKLEKLYPLYSNELIKLTTFRDSGDFKQLEYKDKCRFLRSVLLITKASPQNAMLNSFSIKGTLGRKTNFPIDLSEASFVSRSITGLHEKSDLIKV